MELIGGVGLLFLFLVFMLHIASIVLVYRDCARKRRSPEFTLLAILAVLCFPIVGLIVYVSMRNYYTR